MEGLVRFRTLGLFEMSDCWKVLKGKGSLLFRAKGLELLGNSWFRGLGVRSGLRVRIHVLQRNMELHR